jgi:hypothetical protein
MKVVELIREHNRLAKKLGETVYSEKSSKYNKAGWTEQIAKFEQKLKVLEARRVKTPAKKTWYPSLEEGEKVCRRCGKNKPLTDFATDHRKADGRCYWCKACKNAYARAWKQSKKNAEVAK